MCFLQGQTLWRPPLYFWQAPRARACGSVRKAGWQRSSKAEGVIRMGAWLPSRIVFALKILKEAGRRPGDWKVPLCLRRIRWSLRPVPPFSPARLGGLAGSASVGQEAELWPAKAGMGCVESCDSHVPWQPGQLCPGPSWSVTLARVLSLHATPVSYFHGKSLLGGAQWLVPAGHVSLQSGC